MLIQMLGTDPSRGRLLQAVNGILRRRGEPEDQPTVPVAAIFISTPQRGSCIPPSIALFLNEYLIEFGFSESLFAAKTRALSYAGMAS